MIKEALQYIVGLKVPEVFNIGNETFSDKQLYKISAPTVNPFKVRSLSAIVEYLKSNFDLELQGKLLVHVESPTSVVVFNEVNENAERSYFLKADAMTPDFCFGHWYDVESFNIKQQSCFVKNEDRDIVLKVVGNIKEEMVQTVGDDGVSQAVTAKTGVATVSKVQVPNPVSLRPFRTFVEVEQPESAFVFRMKNGPACALFEADGGAWKLEAMRNIKAYLEEHLQKEIEKEAVVIIA